MTCAYRREIHHAHVAIRDWLAGDSRADALDALMARFAEDFSMVTPHGVVLDKTALGELFRSKGGTRPGLRIEIDGEFRRGWRDPGLSGNPVRRGGSQRAPVHRSPAP
ncbi:hypothetical protein AAIH27_23195 [Pseudomonas aeruginosa]|uniref:hypothetical protein n=1 Tax=Pseudomonas aeruginosa TaxID=287 RepID=UPI0031B73FAA